MKNLRAALLGLTATAAGFLGAGSPARADFVSFDPDGGAATNAPISVGSFGFDTGNVLAKESVRNGQILPVGSTFQLYYQARLSNVSVSGGGTVTPAGLNGSAGGPAFEITVVGSFTEVVTSVAPGGGSATFALAAVQDPSSFIRMFYHAGVSSDNFSGAGFATGTQILSAVPNAVPGSSGTFSVSVDAMGNPVGVTPFDTFDPATSVPGLAYAGLSSVKGSGSSQIDTTVTAFDSAFFKSTPVLTLTLNSFNSVPFDATTPSQFFNDITNAPVIAANRGAVNGVSGPDFQFEARGSASVTVPEPGSIALLGIGVVGLLGYGWRRQG